MCYFDPMMWLLICSYWIREYGIHYLIPSLNTWASGDCNIFEPTLLYDLALNCSLFWSLNVARHTLFLSVATSRTRILPKWLYGWKHQAIILVSGLMTSCREDISTHVVIKWDLKKSYSQSWNITNLIYILHKSKVDSFPRLISFVIMKKTRKP